MTKQEEIREGMFAIVRGADYLELPEKEWEYALVDNLRNYLHKQGVVVKVFNKGGLKLGHAKQEVGWVDYEPLIKEE